jgi:hypothetical protein
VVAVRLASSSGSDGFSRLLCHNSRSRSEEKSDGEPHVDGLDSSDGRLSCSVARIERVTKNWLRAAGVLSCKKQSTYQTQDKVLYPRRLRGVGSSACIQVCAGPIPRRRDTLALDIVVLNSRKQPRKRLFMRCLLAVATRACRCDIVIARRDC